LRFSLALVAVAHDVLVARLLAARALALGRYAPRRHRMAAAGGPTFSATVRMVDRVHRDAAHRRPDAEPAAAARLADGSVLVVRIGHGADRRHAACRNHAQLARAQPQLCVPRILADQLGVGTPGARDLATASRLHLDV